MQIVRKAQPSDCPVILELIKELAVYERAADQVEINELQLEQDLFGTNSIASCLIGLHEEHIIGIAIYYTKYSTWKGKCIYLEDIIVREAFRGLGMGNLLFNEVVQHATQLNAGRMEWQVLDWNTPAIEFYKGRGAILDPTWINCKFTREQLQQMKSKK